MTPIGHTVRSSAHSLATQWDPSASLRSMICSTISGALGKKMSSTAPLGYAMMDSKNPKELDEDLIFYYYGVWMKSHPLDAGKTTIKALNHFILKKIHMVV